VVKNAADGEVTDVQIRRVLKPLDLPARTIRRTPQIALLAAVCLIAGCGGEKDRFIVVLNPGDLPPISLPTPRPTTQPAPPGGAITVAFSFRREAEPWQVMFADYAAAREMPLRTRAGLVRLPRELGADDAFLLSGDGDPGGLFSGIWRQVDGLRPYTSYRMEFQLTLASNLAGGCTGSVARAGELQVVKAGASGVVPLSAGSDFVRLPIDKGTPTGDGRNMVAVGDLTVPELRTCTQNNRYYAKQLSSRGRGPIVATDSVGRIWLILGVDSTYEHPFSYYIVEGRFVLTPT
jgi:hypothetical protein